MSTSTNPNSNSQRLIALSELLSKPQEDIEYLVEGMLIRGGLGLLAGKPKAGKSTLARVLALSIARGESFLGFPTNQGSVLYYGLEEKESEVRRHFDEMGAHGNEPITISTKPLPGKEIETLVRDIVDIKPQLVIIDPLFRVIKAKDSNNYAEMTAKLDPLLQISREHNTHVLCVHHLGKGGVGADAILGSTAIRGAFDVNLLLNKTEQRRTIQSENRYGENIDESELVFDTCNRTITLGEKRADVEAERVAKDILAALHKSDSCFTEQEIEKLVHARTLHKRIALRKLRESEAILRFGTGKKGDPFRYSISRPHVPSPSHGTREQETHQLITGRKDEHGS